MKNRWMIAALVVLTLPFVPAHAWSEDEPPVATSQTAYPLDDRYANLELFANAITLVDSHYVESKSTRELIYGALKGMLSALDPYSQFLEPEEFQEIKEDTEGQFGGIGVEISSREGVLTVISPVDGTPASEAGLKPQDKIVRINGQSTRNLTLDDAVKLLRGKPGTEVKLTILRESENRLIDFVIKRDTIQVKSIKDALMIAENVGYVRISEFQEHTSRDLRDAVETLKKKGMKGLVLDLRNNPGGLLPAAVKVSEQFVPAGELIVYTQGRRDEQNLKFQSEGVESKPAYPMVVLVNNGSASASEIVAGSLQDHRIAIVMGSQTFGKGSVQTVIPLKDGSALRLTTSRYYTPNGRMIHNQGIKPDVLVPLDEVQKSSEAGPDEKKSTRIFDSLEADSARETPKQWDNQVMSAVRLIEALLVYGNR